MKTNYAVIRNGKVVYESDNLKDIEKVKKELEYRQTGRTTRMLFQALGDPNPYICIIGHNNVQAKCLFRQTKEILHKLGFDFECKDDSLEITNFGKTYYFRGNSYGLNVSHNVVNYLDEK